ncbi:hypothetical protein IMG5_195230 [Ichthyophthirius multifiliis]|uniref:Glutamine-dependent NAD(+) synthetase n=1 Tax=Ichthyophthirius multifiliis TaxID=5932 RepID=G0R4X9_ICHMU|nr:hypothetical protein IMG5_195230 [Ichthyophthirius multifiliis]EGR27476.1 hypothetical protein IMG5_195230 [Ichthyophthirius multifiliis]|eukprot:XP_004024386.1 hypothetical protein IMG5_195230 [Ichthyophthirius multifiliis]
MQLNKEVNELVFTRLKQERKQWRQDHPHRFVAKPTTKDDGTINMLKWYCEIPGPEGSPWEEGVYILYMDFSQSYPIKPPKYEPNIDSPAQYDPSKENKCTIRLGPELEISGYGCEDHFLELDTVTHSWEVLGEILSDSQLTKDILCAIGMPVLFNTDGGNYREPRYFTAWKSHRSLEELELPQFIQKITNQKYAPFGNAIIQTNDTRIGIETCQELWVPSTLSSQLGLNGVEIFLNQSGSHYEVHKQKRRLHMILEATIKTGGVYIYSNLRGCDGSRVYFDGASIVAQNGKVLGMTDMFSLQNVDVVVSDIDLGKVRSHRAEKKSFGEQSVERSIKQQFPIIKVDFQIANINFFDVNLKELDDKEVEQFIINDMSYGPSCFLWDYLRRSGASGYFLPFSGGADSASSALIVFNMCEIAYQTIKEKEDLDVLETLRKIVGDENYNPQNSRDICKKLLFTAYMGSRNSSLQTKLLAKQLADEINSRHFEISIDKIFQAFEDTIEDVFEKKAQFNQSYQEDLALQNIQARSRMVLAFIMGQLAQWKDGRQGFLLVLGSSNLDEGLRGYFTKYDCSSADINPIGSISKNDIKAFLKWNYNVKGIQSALKILEAVPTAELRPMEDNKITQADEQDMGMSYNDLSVYGRLRKIEKLGPVSMFKKLAQMWKDLNVRDVGEKVKKFFKFYSINRHKQTTLTPSFHAENYSIDDNRFDLRQFLYNSKWTYQFQRIDYLIDEREKYLKANQKK